jgi:hypothetical protein
MVLVPRPARFALELENRQGAISVLSRHSAINGFAALTIKYDLLAKSIFSGSDAEAHKHLLIFAPFKCSMVLLMVSINLCVRARFLCKIFRGAWRASSFSKSVRPMISLI